LGRSCLGRVVLIQSSPERRELYLVNKVTFEPAFFRKRAKQCKHLAHGMKNKKIQNQLISLATEYEAMAAQFEKTRKKPADLAEALAPRSRLKRGPLGSKLGGRSGWLH
jgi:hypothetical protein